MYLEIGLIQQSGGCTRPMTSLALVVGLFSGTTRIFPLAEQVFPSNQSAVGYHQVMCAATTPLGLSCHADHCYSSQHHGWEGLLVVSPLWKLAQYQKAQNSPYKQIQASNNIQTEQVIFTYLGTYLHKQAYIECVCVCVQENNK